MACTLMGCFLRNCNAMAADKGGADVLWERDDGVRDLEGVASGQAGVEGGRGGRSTGGDFVGGGTFGRWVSKGFIDLASAQKERIRNVL